jgi:hypothetical protein
VIETLRGKTVRWTFSDGQVAGMRFEHTFNEDGSVVWRIVDGPGKGASAREARCATDRVSDAVHTISYLAASGHTLTVVLDLATGHLIGFASNDKEWSSQRGTFEVMP